MLADVSELQDVRNSTCRPPNKLSGTHADAQTIQLLSVGRRYMRLLVHPAQRRCQGHQQPTGLR